jgi:hypothetical protein
MLTVVRLFTGGVEVWRDGTGAKEKERSEQWIDETEQLGERLRVAR